MDEYKKYHIFQFYAYDWRAWKEMEEWLTLGPKGEVKRFGWDDGCSSITGIAIKEPLDAMMFKLLFVGRSARDATDDFRIRAIAKLSGQDVSDFYGDDDGAIDNETLAELESGE